ncbi:MAG: Na+/H+ antiporter NhaA [Chloroflexi bacterium]|nr:Na+/H+ antiporter NhaA [Chloroflexota bacterium]
MMQHSAFARMLLGPAQSFIHTEEVGAVVLLLATLTALIWANSPWSGSYHSLWGSVLTLDLGAFRLSESVGHWVNDGLMAVFFFVVGLELKRELVHGELSTRKKAALPLLAAAGGILAPALLYLAFNAGTDQADGWGVPVATDIAFAVGVLALVGRRLPGELRIFLLALAVVDDLGAILVIALFYSEGISWGPLLLAFSFLMTIVAAQRLQVRLVPVYAVLGTVVWAAVLKSGIHPTIAGVALGLLTPSAAYLRHARFAEEGQRVLDSYREALRTGNEDLAQGHLGEMEELAISTESPMERLERLVHPWTGLVVLPVFALANAGIELSRDTAAHALSSPVTLGVFTGLLLGKVIGIFTLTWLAVRLGVGDLPTRVTSLQILGVGMLGGIGFTVAIFIAGLAFEDPAEAKMGIFGASVLAAVGGYLFLRFVATRGAFIDKSTAT